MNTTNLPMAAAVPNTEESPRINPSRGSYERIQMTVR